MDSRPAHDLGVVLADFAKLLAEDHGTAEVLHRLGDYVTDLLPVDGVGILLATSQGGVEVATANTDAGRAVEELEVELLEGPCTDCMETGEQVLAPDLAALADRYPRFAPKATDAGIRSIHAFPMSLRGQQLGSMDVVATNPTHLDAGHMSTAQVLADVAITYVANTRMLHDKTTLATQLQHALDSRVIIEQAKGILAERHQLTVTAAFDRLRQYARGNQRKLHQVASEIVQGELEI
jgi:GAF domain-containing protein